MGDSNNCDNIFTSLSNGECTWELEIASINSETDSALWPAIYTLTQPTFTPQTNPSIDDDRIVDLTTDATLTIDTSSLMWTNYDWDYIDDFFDTDFTTPYIFEFKMKSTKNDYDTAEETLTITINIEPCDGSFTENTYEMPSYKFAQDSAQNFCFFAINTEACA